jgi:hypothetical protein
MHRLPHTPPVKFVESILKSEEFDSRTKLRFPYMPTLPMIAEAAAQSAVFVRVTKIKKALGIPEDETARGMLLKIKSKLHTETPPEEGEMQVHYVSNLDNFFVMRFEFFGEAGAIAEGELNIFLEGDAS